MKINENGNIEMTREELFEFAHDITQATEAISRLLARENCALRELAGEWSSMTAIANKTNPN